MWVIDMKTPNVERIPLAGVKKVVQEVIASQRPLEGARIQFMFGESGGQQVFSAANSEANGENIGHSSRTIMVRIFYDPNDPLFSYEKDIEAERRKTVSGLIANRFEQAEVAVCFVQMEQFNLAPSL